MSCIFCNYSQNGPQVLYENEDFYIKIDLYPVSAKHLLIIPKKHILAFEEILPIIHNWYFAIVKAKEITKEVNFGPLYTAELNQNEHIERVLNSLFINQIPQDFNIGLNDGICAGRTVHHMHWHLIPRYLDDVAECRGGVRNIIPLPFSKDW